MTKESLTAYFTSLGLAVSDNRQEPGAFQIHVELGGGILLSIVGGRHCYSTPRTNAGAFEELEIAVLAPNGGFIHAQGKADDDDVEGYVDFARIVEVTDQFAPGGAPHLILEDSE